MELSRLAVGSLPSKGGDAYGHLERAFCPANVDHWYCGFVLEKA
jgi:hypothetical protein